MAPTINVEHEEVSYLIYVTCDGSACTKCHKPGHIARNCHTKAQPRLGPITFADLAAGRQVTNPTPSTIYLVVLAKTTIYNTYLTNNSPHQQPPDYQRTFRMRLQFRLHLKMHYSIWQLELETFTNYWHIEASQGRFRTTTYRHCCVHQLLIECSI
jgi:hypothetical protein